MSVGAVARDLERDRPRQTLTGFLALTFGTLLSSQGSGAHQDRAFRPGLGATALTYPGGLRVSNSFPAPPPPRVTLLRDRGPRVRHAWCGHPGNGHLLVSVTPCRATWRTLDRWRAGVQIGRSEGCDRHSGRLSGCPHP